MANFIHMLYTVVCVDRGGGGGTEKRLNEEDDYREEETKFVFVRYIMLPKKVTEPALPYPDQNHKWKENTWKYDERIAKKSLVHSMCRHREKQESLCGWTPLPLAL